MEHLYNANCEIWKAAGEATRCEHEYLEHAKEALHNCDGARAIHCLAVAEKMHNAAMEILSLREESEES